MLFQTRPPCSPFCSSSGSEWVGDRTPNERINTAGSCPPRSMHGPALQRVGGSKSPAHLVSGCGLEGLDHGACKLCRACMHACMHQPKSRAMDEKTHSIHTPMYSSTEPACGQCYCSKQVLSKTGVCASSRTKEGELAQVIQMRPPSGHSTCTFCTHSQLH